MMKNSKLPAAWLARVMQQAPITKIPNGNLRSGPVRLAFEHLITPVEKTNDDGKKSMGHDCVLLFPPGADQAIQAVFYAEWYALAKQTFPQNFNAQTGQPFGLHWPFHMQDEKQQYSGYTPGCWYVGVGSQYKPSIVDSAGNPIVDPSRVYSGAWAIVSLNAYAYGNRPGAKKKGVSFGIQSVMMIADDDKLGGAAADPSVEFAGLQIDSAFDPAGQFGVMPQAQPVAMPGMAPPNYAPLNYAPINYAPPAYAPPPAALSLDDMFG
jgi:hypothetical protein